MFFSNTTGGKWNPYAQKKGADLDYKGIVAQIVLEVEDLTRKGIQEWRQALEAANNPDNPRWQPLQDLYETLSADGHLVSQVRIRKAAVLSKRFAIRDSRTGEEDKDKTRLLQKRWFLLMISDLLEHIFRGYTVLQIPEAKRIMKMNPLEDKYFLVPRRNFVPQTNFLFFETFGDEGVYITDKAFNNTIVCVKSADKYGVLNYIIPDLIWKRNARQGWAIFSERFGIPLVKIETNRTQKRDIDALEEMAKKMGQAARAVMPVGSKMDIIDSATKGDPYKVYLEQVNLGNSEISKAILGGTMISDNGASRSQSEVMERTLDEKLTEMDLLDMEFAINDQVLPILRAGGWPLTEFDEFAYDRSESLSLADHWKIAKEAMQEGYTFEDQWIQETFSLPVTGKVEKKPVIPGAPQTEDENFKTPPGEKKPAASGGVAWPVYPNASGCCLPVAVTDLYKKKIAELQEQIMEKLYAGEQVKSEYTQKGILVGGSYRDGLFDGWGERRLEIGYDSTDHKALAAMEMNLFTFTNLREKASVFELNKLLLDDDGKKRREYKDFVEAAKPHLENMNTRWLETEYNFAVATGQGASSYHRFLNEAQSVTKFLEYLTVGDGRVRPKHQVLHGRKFNIDDPEARRLWPPNDWGCRCEFVQYIGDVGEETITTGKKGMELLEWTDKQQKLFGVNRGDIGQVFLQNQMYISDAGLAADIKSMTFDQYGLRKWDDMKEALPPLNLDESITTDNVSELFRREPGKDYMGFKDYLNRSLVLDKDVFDEHTQQQRYTNDKENRHRLFPKLEEALSAPDEVYLFDYKKGVYQYRYVKFYKDGVLVVPAKLGNNNLEITTWYTMKTKEDAQRSGLLIKGGK